jgi:hypothetical protein
MWPAECVNARIPPVETGVDKDGKDITTKASTWLRQNRPIAQLTWAPGYPDLIERCVATPGGFVNHDSSSIFNTYRPPNIDWQNGDPEKAQRWVDFVEYLYPTEGRRFIQWMAAKVQKPDLKINHGIVLGGAPGIGKDTLIAPLREAVGPWNFAEIRPSELISQYNPYVQSVILRINEAHDLGDIKHVAFHEATKNLMTSPPEMLPCNDKYARRHNVLNALGVIITTNHRTNGIFLPADDRRHFVMWSEATKEKIAEDLGPRFFTEMWTWYTRGGFRDIAAYLNTLDLGDFSRTEPPPKTPAFYEIVYANQNSEDAELADAIERLGNPLVLTLSLILSRADSNLQEMAKDPRGKNSIRFKLERAGYVSVANPNANDGLWKVGGRRQKIWAAKDLSLVGRGEAAEALVKADGQLSALDTFLQAGGRLQ